MDKPGLIDDPFPGGRNFQKIEAWFKRRLDERLSTEIQLLAARAAMRSLPYLIDLQIIPSKMGDFSQEQLFLASLRRYPISASAVLVPDAEIEQFRSATVATITAVKTSAYSVDDSPAAAYSAAAADAAAAYPVAHSPVAAAVYSAAAAAAASATAASHDAYAYSAAYFAAAFEQDCLTLDQSGLEALASARLWPRLSDKILELYRNREGWGTYTAGMPLDLRNIWDPFRVRLRDMPGDFAIWEEWYEGVLAGEQAGRYLFDLPTKRAFRLMIDVALIDDALWKGNPAALNAEFRNLVEKARGEQELTDRPDLTSILQTEPYGATFSASSDEHLQMDARGTSDDLEAWQNTRTRQLFKDTLRKLEVLQEPGCVQRLSNNRTWAGLTQVVEILAESLSRDESELAANIVTTWSLSVDLASWLDLDTQLRANPETVRDPMPEDIRRPVLSLIESLAVFVRRFPSAREADEELGAFRAPPETQGVTGRLVISIREAQLVRQTDQAVIDAAILASQTGGTQGNKALNWIAATVRNLFVGGMVVVGPPATIYATAFLARVAELHAENSPLVKRFIDWTVLNEKDILEAFEGSPADKRAAIEEAIRRAKEQGVTPRIGAPEKK
jgi:hypothetical protein